MVDVFVFSTPGPSTSEGRLEHVIFLRGPSVCSVYGLFHSADLPLITNKIIYTHTLPHICTGEMQADFPKNKNKKENGE